MLTTFAADRPYLDNDGPQWCGFKDARELCVQAQHLVIYEEDNIDPQLFSGFWQF